MKNLFGANEIQNDCKIVFVQLLTDFGFWGLSGKTYTVGYRNLGVGPSAVIKLSKTLTVGSHFFVDRYNNTNSCTHAC